MRRPGDLLLRVADSLGMTRLREGVLLPAVADLQHECGEAALSGRRAWVVARGYGAIVSGCFLYAAFLPSRHVRENWAGFAAPGPRLIRLAAPAALLVVMAHLIPGMAAWPNSRRLGPEVMALLVPSFVLSMAPLALAIGVGWALTREPSVGRAAVGVGLMGALLLFAFFDVAVAPANQAYRVASYRALTGKDTPLRRGSREMTFQELGVESVVAVAPGCVTPGGGCGNHESESWLRSEWHNRLSLPMQGFTFVVLAAALSRGRRRIVVVPALWFSFAAASLIMQFGQRSSVRGEIPVVLGAWSAHILPLGLTALLLLTRRGRPSALPAPVV